MKKRFLSIALVLCMLLSIVPLTPVVATAETVTPTTVAKDITLGTSAIQEPAEVVNGSNTHYTPNSYIYFGKNGATDIKWRVLDADKANDGKTDGMFLLSEYVLATDIRFNANSSKGNQYQGSDAQTWCKNFAENFSPAEQKAMFGVTKPDDEKDLYSIEWGASSLTTEDKLFFLSAEELANYVGNYNKAPGLAATTDASKASARWWLRSPYAYYTMNAGVVYHDGVVYGDSYVDGRYGARPALNLNPASVLFTSAAYGGKSSNAAVGVVTENKNYDDIKNNDGYKLTLLDESRSGFSAYLKSLSGNTATVSYSGAKTETSEYISVIIKNGNDVKYYGRVCEATSASGDVDITLPNGYNPADGDVLCVFNEQYNGDYKTDYASDLVVLPDYRWYTSDTTKTEFTISTVSEMVGFANLVNGTNLPDGVSKHDHFSGKTVKLANNIDLSCIANWMPIGKDDARAYEGIFDGNNKTVSNLTVNIEAFTQQYAGLFGSAGYATIQNLTVSGSVGGTAGQGYFGGIVGEMLGGSIKNCFFSGNVNSKGTSNYVGGIVGNIHRGSITNCSVSGNVTDTAIGSLQCNYVGGIAGIATTSTISKCTNNGSVTANVQADHVGGIVGMITGLVTISACYNTGIVSTIGTDAKVGGIVGWIKAYDNNSPAISACYNTGIVFATETDAKVGGAIGYIEIFASNASVTIEGLYYLDSVATIGVGKIDNQYDGTVTDNSAGKSSFAFGSGEVAWLLQNAAADADGQVWGQTLTGSDKDNYPVFANENGSNKVYKVTFKVDGKADQIEYVNGGTVSVSNPIAPNGYAFGGWYTAQTGGTEVTTITEDITLYARFTPDIYTVTYNAGVNGTGTVAADSKTHGVDFTLSSNTFTRTGYTQTGWATSDGGDKVYDLGGKYTTDADITLYPVWKANQYTITVKPTNGNKDITIKQDYGTTVTAPTLTRDGYEFDGWDKTFPTTMPAEDMTITAKWKDVTAPTGEIKLGKNSWKTFLNNITFGLFFKDTQEVTITATDNSGEAVKIEYLLSDKELTAEELATATFTAYNDKFTVEPNNEYVIYAKLSDKTGNITYINSNGIVLDNIVPVISGITNGETYCEAQTVTVSDKYEVTVTVNGTPITLDANGQFTLSPAIGTQTVVATDKAGNVSVEMVVTVNDGHTYEWQNENGQYWQECQFCGDETAKKDIPAITINGADKVCVTQGYRFTVAVPDRMRPLSYRLQGKLL